MRSLILRKKGTAAAMSEGSGGPGRDAAFTNFTKARARTLAGVPFSPQSDLFLRALGRARGYDGDVWVPQPTARALGLVLRQAADPPARVGHANGDCLYYHSSQFKRSLDEIKGLLARFTAARQEPALESTLPEEQLPRNTNGERFERAAELQMIGRAGRHGYTSRYWATPQEARYLFRSPFLDAFLGTEEHGVKVSSPFTSKLLYYYNVSGTTDPAKFTPEFCQRYDPYNFHGRFYRPITAVQLKRSAIDHNCLEEQLWVTPLRAQWLHITIKRGVNPVIIAYEPGAVVQLVNLEMTENPKRLREQVLVQRNHLKGDEKREDRMLVF